MALFPYLSGIENMFCDEKANSHHQKFNRTCYMRWNDTLDGTRWAGGFQLTTLCACGTTAATQTI